jgi:hypothetical protein
VRLTGSEISYTTPSTERQEDVHLWVILWLVNFHNPRRLHDGRSLLAFRKPLCTFAIDVHAGKLLAVMVIHGHLPVAVFAPAILLEPARTPRFLLGQISRSPHWSGGFSNFRAPRTSSNLAVNGTTIYRSIFNAAPSKGANRRCRLGGSCSRRAQNTSAGRGRESQKVANQVVLAKSAGFRFRSFTLCFFNLYTAGFSLDCA